jgi:hypothetical protein
MGLMCFVGVQAAWFEMLLIRTDTCKKVNGQLSGVIGTLLQVMFSQTSHNMMSSGIMLDMHGGGQLRVFLKVGGFVADEAALHYVYGCKGSSGLKPCLLCQNVFNYQEVRGIVDRDATGFAQHHTCSDYSKLVLHTPSTMRALVAKLQASAGTAHFGELQTRLGWSYNPYNIPFTPAVADIMTPSSTAVFDWMHIYFVGGVWNVHVGQMMTFLKGHGVTYATLNAYVKEFRWPSAIGTTSGVTAFEPKRAKSSWTAGSLKVTASEGLSLCPVLGHFMHSLDKDGTSADVKQHVKCFMHLVGVVELLRRSSRGNVLPAQLQAAVCRHLTSFSELYGPGYMTIKFHYSLHLHAYLARYGLLLNCFVHERKHRIPKRFANEVRNTNSDWDASVMREVTAYRLSHLHSLGFGETSVALLDPHPPSKKLVALLQQVLEVGAGATFATSRRVRLDQWEKCTVGDLVLQICDGCMTVGVVEWHASCDVAGEVYIISSLRVWEFISGSDRSWKYRRTLESHLCTTEEIKCTLIYAGAGEIATVLKPAHV